MKLDRWNPGAHFVRMRKVGVRHSGGGKIIVSAMKIDGYMIRAEYNGELLCLDGTNKAAQVALRGEDHDQGPLMLPVSDIAAVELKPASVLANGRLTVRTKDGRKYSAHFRRKQQADWERLEAALGI